MLRIGLTGGVGSGKSTAARLLNALGASVVDADAISRSLTAPGGAAISQISRRYGTNLITSEGGLDRAAMRALIFQESQARYELEAILHPLIASEIARQSELHLQSGCRVLIHDIPLLTESSARWRPQLDAVWVVDCTPEEQIRRVMTRNALSVQQVQDVMAAQASRAQRLTIADTVIGNHADVPALQTQLEALWRLQFGSVARAA
jgi:dephospho-CoA kinase